MRKFTLSEAVQWFGTEKQKQAIEKSGNLMTKQFNALIKEIERHYELVKVEGRGSKRMIICDKERKEIAIKKDNRKNNGARQLPYEYELNSLVLDYVLNNCKNNFVSMSLTQWLLKIGLVDLKIVVASNNEGVMHQHLHLLKEKYGNKFTDKDIVTLRHFVETEVNRLRRNLASVFEKLAKHKIIIHTKEMYCCQLDDEHRALSKLELKQIAEIKRELCKKHYISLNDLRFQKYNPAVVAFKEDYEEQLNEMGIKYAYESHGCVVQVSDKIINEYFDKLIEKDELVFSYGLSKDNITLMVSDFKDSYTNHSLDLAEQRQSKVNKSDHKHIRQLKTLKEYLPMWELLLIFYELTNYIEPKYTDINEESIIDLVH